MSLPHNHGENWRDYTGNEPPRKFVRRPLRSNRFPSREPPARKKPQRAGLIDRPAAAIDRSLLNPGYFDVAAVDAVDAVIGAFSEPRLRNTWIEPSRCANADTPFASYITMTSGLPSPFTSATVTS